MAWVKDLISNGSWLLGVVTYDVSVPSHFPLGSGSFLLYSHYLAGLKPLLTNLSLK